MTGPKNNQLGIQEVEKVAKLARLKLNEDELGLYAGQLSSILEHIAELEKLDIEGVEPMAHPIPLNNRLDDDIPCPRCLEVNHDHQRFQKLS
jgi:aspartyl-tRNA(Asn)/glutamyl-tRNA(Gln) amidotransferase subunit C